MQIAMSVLAMSDFARATIIKNRLQRESRQLNWNFSCRVAQRVEDGQQEMEESRQMSIAQLIAEPDLRPQALAELKLVLRPIRRRLRAVRLATVRDVHQARVEIRRARAALVLLRPLLAPERSQRLERSLRKLGRLWSPVRDLDVLVERSLEWPAGKRGERHVEFLYRLAALRQEVAYSALEATRRRFADKEFRARRNCLPAEVISGVVWKRQLITEMQGIFRTLAVPLEIDAGDPAGDLSGLHERRKRCRLLRYQLELLRGDSDLNEALRFLRTAQGLLGNVQDAVVIRHRIATDLGELMGEKLRLFGLRQEEAIITEGVAKLLEFWESSNGWVKFQAVIEKSLSFAEFTSELS